MGVLVAESDTHVVCARRPAFGASVRDSHGGTQHELIAEADRRGVLIPLPGNIIKFRASIYADNLVIFLLSDSKDFSCIRQILEMFAGASGLSTNLSRCQMTPIRCSDTELAAVQQVFPCQIQHFPCQYLGAPLSLSRLHRSDEQRLVDKVAACIPTWKSGLLNAAGRATLTQTTLSAIPVHISITCCLSACGAALSQRRVANVRSHGQLSKLPRTTAAWELLI